VDPFRAYVATKQDDSVDRQVTTLSEGDLPDAPVTVRVAWSSVNYKDGLATIPKGRVARVSPLVPGVDLAGEVVESEASDVSVGQQVIVHGYDLGVSHHGGFAEYARVPADWVVPLPEGLTTRQAMAIGTAGYTAALSVHLLEERGGLKPAHGPVLVTGATGGVGSTAVGILASRGYEVVASSGKSEEHAYLRELGASSVISREETSAASDRPLESQRWAGAVDAVGGSTLAYVLRTLRIGGAVAASGNTGGLALQTTVAPFILRGVSLLGADSVNTPIALRRELWGRIATDLRPRGLDDAITREVDLDGLEPVLDAILRGEVRGRTVVRLGG
jgi:acrylyl-CoA reductase (NADPH)